LLEQEETFEEDIDKIGSVESQHLVSLFSAPKHLCHQKVNLRWKILQGDNQRVDLSWSWTQGSHKFHSDCQKRLAFEGQKETALNMKPAKWPNKVAGTFLKIKFY